MCKKNIVTMAAVAILALAIGQVQAETVNVPNGTFHMYKPGTDYTVLATFPEGNIWTTGMGDNAPINGDLEANYGDGTSGKAVDCPGWITPIESEGSPTNTCDLFTWGFDETDGSSCLNAFGAWSGQNGTLAESAESLGNIIGGATYTVSAMINGNAGHFTLELRAGGIPMTPSSSVNPITQDSGTSGWEVISTTYDSAAVADYVGEPITIVIGTKRPGPGDPELYGARSRLDNVSLSYEAAFRAANPSPADEVTDVCRKPALSWTPGIYADKHDVYFGTDFDDVTNASNLDPMGPDNVYRARQDANSYTVPETLDFGQTYYWRVDEVNAPPTSDTEFKGQVWSFTTEPIGYPVDGNNITTTASSSKATGEGPENTINGSGLDANDLHSTEMTDMWLSNEADANAAWIQYEFDKVYKLHQMWVWNHNTEFEVWVGFGFKDVTIEYSTNGTDWTVLAGVTEFARGTGSPDYAHNTPVDFDGVVAKYVKISANSNWSAGVTTQYGLSEVRFFYIPVQARYPNPQDGATGVGPDVVLNWRAGREAAEHNVYVSTKRQAVINGTAPVTNIPAAGECLASHDAGTLELGKTYYWKINEVNTAETPTTWEGDVWSFATPEYFVVEDFEDYNDFEPDRIFETWKGGYGYIGYCGNGTGSAVGHPSYPYAEQAIVHEGSQSMPVYYDNSGTGTNSCGQPINLYYSETERTFDTPQDWTRSGVRALTLYFYGDPDNDAGATEQLYLKVNGAKVVYEGDMADIKEESWHEWNIDLASFAGVNLQSVTKVSIGLGNGSGPGGSGVVYFDDIRLYPSKCVLSRRSADFARVDYIADCVVDCKELELMADNWLAVPAATGIVPNGDFELMYKPATAITGVVSGGGWTQGVGPDCPIDSGEYVFSDETTGTVADIPGWIGYDRDGWIVLGGTYDRDQTTGNLQGSVASQGNYTPDGLHCYLSNGGGYGNAAGGLIVSDAPLGNVEDGTYTLSMVAQGGATPVVLDLLAGGVALTPASSVNPELTGDWQEFSRTYDSASLASFLGEPLTIVLGVDRNAAGNQTRFDDVTLLHNSEPLPILPLAAQRVDLYEDMKIDFKDFAELAAWWLGEQLWP